MTSTYLGYTEKLSERYCCDSLELIMINTCYMSKIIIIKNKQNIINKLMAVV